MKFWLEFVFHDQFQTVGTSVIYKDAIHTSLPNPSPWLANVPPGLSSNIKFLHIKPKNGS